MSEVYFVLKAFAVTIVLVFVMQMKVGNSTIEERSLNWMHHSGAIESLRGVADGGVLAVTNGLHYVMQAAENLYEKQFGNHSSNSSSGRSSKTSTPAAKKDSRQDWEREASRPHGDEVE
jgi:uncharacterized membrane protein